MMVFQPLHGSACEGWTWFSFSGYLRRRKEITCSFSKKSGEFGLCFWKFIEQVISLQALVNPERINPLCCGSQKTFSGSLHGLIPEHGFIPDNSHTSAKGYHTGKGSSNFWQRSI